MARTAWVVALTIAALLLLSCDAVERRKHHDNCPVCDGDDEAPDPGDFSFYFLVRQWGPEYCHRGDCTREPDTTQFTLHGLWPNLDNPCLQDYPEHCPPAHPFDFDLISEDTRDKMKTDWPSYKNSDFCFYTHEWDCHGSCSGLSQSDYFSKVVALHEKYSIMDALSEANIEPADEPIRTSDVVAAVKDRFGVEPILHCSKGGGKEYLNEVYMCVSKDLKVVDCATVCKQHACVPSLTEDKQDFCGDELIFKIPSDNLALLPMNATANQECKLCKPKSGTCKPSGGGHGSAPQGVTVTE